MKKIKLNIQMFSVQPFTYLAFEDLPSTNTPINASNLNDMQDSIHSEIENIITEGSNNNGRYIKYDDGTLICYASKTFVFGFTDQQTSINGYSSGKLSLNNYPEPFISTPVITGSVTKSDGQWAGWWSGEFEGGTLTNPGKTEFFRATSTAADVVTYTINYIAIGRWK